jgi:hypothetical protein
MDADGHRKMARSFLILLALAFGFRVRFLDASPQEQS